MRDGLAMIDYGELSEGEEPARKRQLLMCPVDNCSDTGTYDNLCSHWARIHKAYTLLYLCPFQRCGHEKMLGMYLCNHVQEEQELIAEGLATFSPCHLSDGTFHFIQKDHASRMLSPAPSATRSAPPAPSGPRFPQVPPQASPQASSATVPDPNHFHQEVTRMAINSPATSSRRMVNRYATVEQLEAHLRGIRHMEVALRKERDDVLHRLKPRSSEELAQLHQEVQVPHQCVGYLQGGGGGRDS